MKSDFLTILRTEPRLRRSDIWLTLVPILFWIAGPSARDLFISPRCTAIPTPCTPQSVLAIDRPVIGLDQPQADWISTQSQNWAGYLAAGLPLAWNVAQTAAGAFPSSTLLARVGTDFLLVAQAVSWNGAINEWTRIVVQRPRPFVYANPGLGADSANYTSFYSGHTSFTAAASLSMVLVLLGRGAPPVLLFVLFLLSQGMTLLTAVNRVLAGRHFTTDVVVGAILGMVIAISAAYLHRSRRV